MEYIQGKQTFTLDGEGLEARLAGFNEVLVDIGTGDGGFAYKLASARPEAFKCRIMVRLCATG